MDNTIVYQQETLDEELKVEELVKEKVKESEGTSNFVSIWGSTLHHIDDLPYDPHSYFPHVYGNFRKKQDHVKVRPLLDEPKNEDLHMMDVSSAQDFEKEALEYLPDLETFGFTKEEINAASKPDKRMYYKFKGGEESGLERMQEWIHSKRCVSKYNDTRNNLIGANYSSKLSPWLANGCLSIRKVYWETKKFEKE